MRAAAHRVIIAPAQATTYWLKGEIEVRRIIVDQMWPFLIAALVLLGVTACSGAEEEPRTGSTRAETDAEATASAPLKREEILTYKGPDRQQRLLAGAKEEGALMLYTSLTAPGYEPLQALYEETYGIPLEVWRASDVLQRVIQEAGGEYSGFDVVETNGPDVEVMAREGILAPFYSPELDAYPEATDHGTWRTSRYQFTLAAYNTSLVRKEELPQTYEDLLEPQWRGKKIGIDSLQFSWLATLVKHWGKEKGMDYIARLAQQAPRMQESRATLTNLLVAGDIPLLLTTHVNLVEEQKAKGAPIEWFALNPTEAQHQGLGVSAKAPHPHAAMLFVDLFFSKEGGQKALQEAKYIPAHPEVETNPPGLREEVPTIPQDLSAVVDEFDYWTDVYNELIAKSGS